MGTDIHCILQKKDPDTDRYETVLDDVFPLRFYALFDFLKEFQSGLPSDFDVTVKPDRWGDRYYHRGFYMGTHSFGSVNLYDFCHTRNADLKHPHYTIDFYNGIHVQFLTEEEDDELALYMVQVGLTSLFGDAVKDYRLVFGYDS